MIRTFYGDFVEKFLILFKVFVFDAESIIDWIYTWIYWCILLYLIMNRNFNTVIWPLASFGHFLFELWKERQLSQFCAAGCRCDQPDTCPPTTVPPPPNQCGVRCSCSAAYYCPENGFSMVLCPIGLIQNEILYLAFEYMLNFWF